MQSKVLANWLYAIQVFLDTAIDGEHRFMVVENNNFKTGCVTRISCGIGQLASYLSIYRVYPAAFVYK